MCNPPVNQLTQLNTVAHELFLTMLGIERGTPEREAAKEALLEAQTAFEAVRAEAAE